MIGEIGSMKYYHNIIGKDAFPINDTKELDVEYLLLSESLILSSQTDDFHVSSEEND